jgi:hypothetical protein
VDEAALTLMEQRRQELLDKGYTANQVQLALDWARNSAQGMADYAGVASDQLLARYLKDAENWLRGIGAGAEG